MFIGLDIGGTKIEICVLDEQGESRFKQRTPTPKNYPDFVATIADLVTLAEQTVGVPCPVGIGIPGAISPATGLVKNANCLFLNGENLQYDLNQRLKREIRIANDANCFALSEAVDGAGQGHTVVFGAILGTGCGGGLVFEQRVWNGANANTGEWGHNPLPGYQVEQDGPRRPCYCGRDNCIEQFISGTGFAITYQQATGKALTAEAIIEQVTQGDAAATRCYQQLVDHMARSFASIINVLDPNVIVLGGGLSNVDTLYRDVPLATAKYVYSDVATLTFAKAAYGDSSGIRGAAWLSSRPA